MDFAPKFSHIPKPSVAANHEPIVFRQKKPVVILQLFSHVPKSIPASAPRGAAILPIPKPKYQHRQAVQRFQPAAEASANIPAAQEANQMYNQ